MPRRPHLRSASRAVVAALMVPLLAACGASASRTVTGALTIKPYALAAGATGPCRAIVAALPTTLNGQHRVHAGGSPFGAAWGTPAIVLRCGVPEPAGFNAVAACQTVNGIDWYLSGDAPALGQEAPGQVLTVTTVYRKPAVEVTVPVSYGTQGPGTAMALLTDVIRAHTTVTNHCV